MEADVHNDDDDPIGQMVRLIWKQMHSEALGGKPTPIVLPAETIEELEAYCQKHSVPIEELIPLAIENSLHRWNEIVLLMAEKEDNPDDFEWPVDVLDCVVIAFLSEAYRRFRENFPDAVDEPDPA